MSSSSMSCPICNKSFINETILIMHVEECLKKNEENDESAHNVSSDYEFAEKLQLEEVCEQSTEWKFEASNSSVYGATNPFDFNKEKDFLNKIECGSRENFLKGPELNSENSRLSSPTLRDNKAKSQISDGSCSTDFSVIDRAELEVEHSETEPPPSNSLSSHTSEHDQTSRPVSPHDSHQSRLSESEVDLDEPPVDEGTRSNDHSHTDTDDEEKDLYEGNYDDCDTTIKDPPSELPDNATPPSKESQENDSDLKPAEKARLARNYEHINGVNSVSLFDDGELEDFMDSDKTAQNAEETLESNLVTDVESAVSMRISTANITSGVDKRCGPEIPLSQPRCFDEFLQYKRFMKADIRTDNPASLFSLWKEYESCKNDDYIYKFEPPMTNPPSNRHTEETSVVNPEKVKSNEPETSAASKLETKTEIRSSPAETTKPSVRDILQRRKQQKFIDSLANQNSEMASNNKQNKDEFDKLNSTQIVTHKKPPQYQPPETPADSHTPEAPSNTNTMTNEEKPSTGSSGLRKGMSLSEWRKARRSLSTNFISKEGNDCPASGNSNHTVRPPIKESASINRIEFDGRETSERVEKPQSFNKAGSNKENLHSLPKASSIDSGSVTQMFPRKHCESSLPTVSHRPSSDRQPKGEYTEDCPVNQNFNFKSFSRPRSRHDSDDQVSVSSNESSYKCRPNNNRNPKSFDRPSSNKPPNRQRNPYTEKLKNRLAELEEWKNQNSKYLEQSRPTDLHRDDIGGASASDRASLHLEESLDDVNVSPIPLRSPISSEDRELHIKRKEGTTSQDYRPSHQTEKPQKRLYRKQRGSAREQMEEFIEDEFTNRGITKEAYEKKKRELQDAIDKGICPMWTVTAGAVSIYRKLHQDNIIDSKSSVKFSREADHFATCLGDKGFGCGYRTFQMLLSSFQWKSEFRKKIFQDKPEIPSIWKIQKCLETAWQHGFDGVDRDEINGTMVDSRHWIGAVDIAAMLSLLGVKCRLIQFGAAPNTTQRELQMSMYKWFDDYFSNSPNGSKFPIYMQYQGHCCLVIGFQKNSSPDISALIMLDSGLNQWRIRDWAKSKVNRSDVKRNIISFDSINFKQYQLIEICGLIQNQEEMQRAKDLQNITTTIC